MPTASLNDGVKAPRPLAVERIAQFDRWMSAEDRWEDLVARAGRDEIYLSHRWLSTWLRHFASGTALWILVVTDQDRWIGAAPLVLTVERWRGLPVRTLHFPINIESGNLRCDVVLSDRGDESVSAVVRYLEAVAGEWDRMVLAGVPASSPTFRWLHPAFERSSCRTTTWQLDHRISTLPVVGSWDEYLSGKSHNFRRNLKRSEERLLAMGDVTHRVFTRVEELPIGLEILFEIEARSSKVDRQGAIRLQGDVRRFCLGLVDAFGPSGECRIDALIVDGRPVGAAFSLCVQGQFFGLYTYYDPSVGHASPGRVLFHKMLESCWALDLREVDLNGQTSFIQSWTEHSRTYVQGLAYSPARRARLVQGWEQLVSPALRQAATGLRVATLTPLPRRASRRSGESDTLPAPLRRASCRYYENGRTALDFGLDRLPLRQGDEILFPSYHCGAERGVLLRRGLRIRYYRVSRTLSVDAASIGSALSPQTRAVYLIHYLGWPQVIQPIADVCRRNGLLLIEDCAQALYGGDVDRPVGSVGDLAIFSLHKFLPLVDGGAAVHGPASEGLPPPPGERRGVNDRLETWLRETGHRARGAAGRAAAVRRLVLDAVDALVGRLGPTSSRGREMSEASRRTLVRIDHRAVMETRRANYRTLLDVFAKRPGCSPLFPVLDDGVVPLLFPVIVDNPPPFLGAMKQAGIEAEILWSAVHPVLALDNFPEVSYLKSHLVVLPVHQDLTADDLLRLREATLRYFERQDAARHHPLRDEPQARPAELVGRRE